MTGFEPAISALTGQRVRPLHYTPALDENFITRSQRAQTGSDGLLVERRAGWWRRQTWMATCERLTAILLASGNSLRVHDFRSWPGYGGSPAPCLNAVVIALIAYD